MSKSGLRFLCCCGGGNAKEYDEAKSPHPKPTKGKKKSANSSAASSRSSLRQEESAAVDSAVLASAAQSAPLKGTRADYIPDGCCKPEPASPTVIENPGAVAPSAPNRAGKVKSAKKQKAATEDVVVTIDTSLQQSKKPSQPRNDESAFELDTGVITLEQEMPAVLEMMEQDTASTQMAATVSHSSFKSAMMTPPSKTLSPPKTEKSADPPTSNVDTSVKEIKVAEPKTEMMSYEEYLLLSTDAKRQLELEESSFQRHLYVRPLVKEGKDGSSDSKQSDGSDNVDAKEQPVQAVAMELSSPVMAEEQMGMETVGTMDAATPDDADVHSVSTSGESVEFSRTQHTETEEMIETEVEETVTMVIVGVVANPGEEEENVISMQDAVSRKILDLANGLYYNASTKEQISMVEAMNTGLIKMGQKKFQKSQERVKSVGIITIRTTRETMPYTVKAATNTSTGSMLDLQKAVSAGILDPEHGTFTDKKTGNKMLIGDAVDMSLVEIEYDMSASGTVQEEVLKTYSVHAVVDQKQKQKLPFHEAVNLGLIDQDTGEYINNVTGEKIPVEEAINRGLIKATQTDKPQSISVDTMGSQAAARGVDAIRKKLLNPLKKSLRGGKN